MPLELSNALDAWRAAQPEPELSRPEAIRRLMEAALAGQGRASAPAPPKPPAPATPASITPLAALDSWLAEHPEYQRRTIVMRKMLADIMAETARDEK